MNSSSGHNINNTEDDCEGAQLDGRQPQSNGCRRLDNSNQPNRTNTHPELYPPGSLTSPDGSGDRCDDDKHSGRDERRSDKREGRKHNSGENHAESGTS